MESYFANDINIFSRKEDKKLIYFERTLTMQNKYLSNVRTRVHMSANEIVHVEYDN